MTWRAAFTPLSSPTTASRRPCARSSTACPWRSTFAPTVSERLDATIEAAAYFVVSEALTNVVKYAEATSASVELKLTDDTLVVTIADDGIGGAEPRRRLGTAWSRRPRSRRWRPPPGEQPAR